MSLKKLFGPSLRLKLLLRRLSVASPKVSIKGQLPLPLRMLVMAVVLGLAGAIALGIYDLGRRLAGSRGVVSEEQLDNLRQKLAQVTAERDRFSGGVDAAESALQIERTAQEQLAAQVKTLIAENARLKEDLAFYDSLLPNTTGQGLAIRRLKAEIIAPNQIRYRLLVMHGAGGNREFTGNLQLAVSVLREGKNAMIVFPDSKAPDLDKYKLSFRHYQRLEGVLTLPDNVTMQSVQARILEKGQVRAQQSANLQH